MGYKHILLVEGKYDFHLLRNLLRKYEIQIVEPSKQLNPQTAKIVLEPKGSDDEVLQGLELLLEDGDLQTIGVILDVDTSLESRWDAVCNQVNRFGESDLLGEPTKSGSIGVLNRIGQRPVRVGVWLMPDNAQLGMLEDFASRLIPVDDGLWLQAQGCVADIPSSKQRFSEVHRRKAELHTWLAWQKLPGRPMGLAMTLGYLDAEAPLAQQFVQWVRNLFKLEVQSGEADGAV